MTDASPEEIRRVAEKAHEGQVDPDWQPHWTHVERVADAVNGDEAIAVALLQDVLEDTALRPPAM